MKPRILVLALAAALGSGCATDQPRMALQIESVMSIRHGVASAQSYYQLGRYYHGQNRLAQAEEAYLKAIAVDDRHVNSLNALGSLHAERGDLKRSIQMLENVTAMAPDTAYLHNNLGYAYYLQGRLDKAYAAVRKALSLDRTLERGWANLEQIAGKSLATTLIAAVKTRQLDALPATFTAKAMADEPRPESAQIAMAQAPGQPSVPPAEAATQTAAQEAKPAETAVASALEAPEAAADAAPVKAAQTEAAPQSHESPPPSLPLEREGVDAHSIHATALAEAVSSSDTRDRDMDVPVALIEVTNGNGVTGFARNFSLQLREDNIPVARITNLPTFSAKKTVIEYQPGYEVAARVLMNRTRLQASLIPAAKPRSRSDVRIVLGRDAVPYLANRPLNLAAANHPEGVAAN